MYQGHGRVQRGYPRRGHGQWRGQRGGGGGRGRGAPYIRRSPDGNSLEYSQFGSERFGDSNIVKNFEESRKVIGKYSEDADRQFVNDSSYISFLRREYLPNPVSKEKKVHLDLRGSESEVQVYTGTGERSLQNSLAWIINNDDIYRSEISRSHSTEHFVTTRNVLCLMAKIIYNYQAEMKFYATRIGDVTFVIKETIGVEKEDENHHVRLWAHKFEELLTKGYASNAACNEDFRVFLSASIGPHRLLYSSATDCANPNEYDEDMTDLSAFISLRSSLKRADGTAPRYTGMYYYLHCLFTGVPKVLVGFRNEEGIVSLLKLYDIPELLENGQEHWNPVNCLNFTSDLLSFIKDKVGADPGAVYSFTKESRKAEIVSRREDDSKKFLSDEFVEHFL